MARLCGCGGEGKLEVSLLHHCKHLLKRRARAAGACWQHAAPRAGAGSNPCVLSCLYPIGAALQSKKMEPYW